MKKSILTIGLLASVMVLTSSFSPEVSNENIAMSSVVNSVDINGSSVGGNRKVDTNGSSVGGNRKVDINGSSVGGNRKVD